VNERISRRDFLNSTLLASGALLMSSVSPAQLMAEDDWNGYAGVGDYSKSNGNTQAVLDAGHRIRDGEFEDFPKNVIDTGKIFDCVIVGGGISGLAAALFFLRQAGSLRKVRLLDYEAYCPRSAADSSRVARTVLSFALHDGQCRGAKLAVPSQDGASVVSAGLKK
jgi:hypothetical protein